MGDINLDSHRTIVIMRTDMEAYLLNEEGKAKRFSSFEEANDFIEAAELSEEEKSVIEVREVILYED